MTDHPVRDCRCKTRQHRHGTNQAYHADRCRCDECRAAHAAVEYERRHGVRAERLFVDDIAVERAVNGHPVPLNRLEVIEAVRILAARRHTDSEIGQRLGKSTQAICKLRGRVGIPSRVPRPARWHAA